MEQVYKLFAAEQVKVLLKRYCYGDTGQDAIEEILQSVNPGSLFS